MRRAAVKFFISGVVKEAKCPFCGNLTEITNPVKYCCGCGSVFYLNKKSKIVFDNKRKHWAFSLQNSGGLRLGGKSFK